MTADENMKIIESAHEKSLKKEELEEEKSKAVKEHKIKMHQQDVEEVEVMVKKLLIIQNYKCLIYCKDMMDLIPIIVNMKSILKPVECHVKFP